MDNFPWVVCYSDVNLGDGVLKPNSPRLSFPAFTPLIAYEASLLARCGNTDNVRMMVDLQLVRYICDTLTTLAVRNYDWTCKTFNCSANRPNDVHQARNLCEHTIHDVLTHLSKRGCILQADQTSNSRSRSYRRALKDPDLTVASYCRVFLRLMQTATDETPFTTPQLNRTHTSTLPCYDVTALDVYWRMWQIQSMDYSVKQRDSGLDKVRRKFPCPFPTAAVQPKSNSYLIPAKGTSRDALLSRKMVARSPS